ncbi:hypothetical protein GCM10010357_62410 [Streptomyces luteireticuli]|uniref:Uncharacterized protein n=1 Tax=Streptomyces luteireticuli TaxID=173858 RepID=A0ABN0Z492_9ACTN
MNRPFEWDAEGSVCLVAGGRTMASEVNEVWEMACWPGFVSGVGMPRLVRVVTNVDGPWMGSSVGVRAGSALSHVPLADSAYVAANLPVTGEMPLGEGAVPRCGAVVFRPVVRFVGSGGGTCGTMLSRSSSSDLTGVERGGWQ